MLVAGVAFAGAAAVEVCSAHVSIPRAFRAGAYPSYEGSGWFVEAYLDVPNFDLCHHALVHQCLAGPGVGRPEACLGADINEDRVVDLRDFARLQLNFHDPHMLRADRYVRERQPDLTFRTQWIDFPAGPADSRLDAQFATLGDFLDDYIFDVSDPFKLVEPFGTVYLRFTGLMKVTFEDEIRVRDIIGLPVWVAVGTMAHDAYRVTVGEIIYQRPNVKWAQPFFNWGPAVEALGLFPIQIDYLNIHDPTGLIGNPRAGIEIYSWHGGGLSWPAGEMMVHEIFGPGTLLPPRVIYQSNDIRPVVGADFDADYDVDLEDFAWYQYCSDPEFFFLPEFCRGYDSNGNNRIQPNDFAAFESIWRGPGRPAASGTGP